MKEIKSIDNCSAFKIFDNDIFWNKQKTLYCNDEINWDNVEGGSFWRIEEFFLIYTYTPVNYLLKAGSLFSESAEMQFDYHGIIKNKIFTYEKKYDENKKRYYKLGFFDLINSKFYGSELINSWIQYIDQQIIIAKNDRIIICLNEKLEMLWNISIEILPNFTQFNEIKQTEILQYYGVYNNILWLQLNGDRLLGLDIITGEQVHLIEDVSKGVGNNYLDVNLGIIKILAGHHYYEFDLNNLFISKKIILDPEEKWFIRSCTFYKDDPNIYFCGHYDNWERTNAFGIYDSESNTIIWHQINDEHGVNYYNPPQANRKVFGILDNNGLLTLFDRN